MREHLLAVAQAGTQQAAVPQTSPHDNLRPLHAATSQETQIDPAIGAPPYPMSGDEGIGDDPLGDARKGRRELSTSKRAAQNRAAQVRWYNYCSIKRLNYIAFIFTKSNSGRLL